VAASDLRIATAELNRWLRDAVGRHEPAMAQRGTRRRPLKFFYATQTGVRPPTFVLFCTEPDAVQESYRRFLENQLRSRFDLEGAPIRLRLRARDESARPR
jgi:GTP-binding protein